MSRPQALKPATIHLERLRDIYRAISGEAFVLILDGVADLASAALLKKLDKENPELKTASPGWCRKRLAELASDAAEPPSANRRRPSPRREEPKGKSPVLTPQQKELARLGAQEGHKPATRRARFGSKPGETLASRSF